MAEPDPRFNPLRRREQPDVWGDAIAIGLLIICLAFAILVIVIGVMKAISAI